MITFPNAKINLGLNIVRKREDGYHEIESCFYPIPWHDSLEIVEAADFAFHTYGLDIPGDADSNLCVKAYQMLKEDFDLPPVAIHLLKQIPMGGGMGGGSADGAFVLTMLNELFELRLSTPVLEAYALRLGSDCPFFVQNQPSIAAGRGEKLKAIDLSLSGYHLALHNPGIHVSTKEAYAGVRPAISSVSISEVLKTPLKEWKNHLVNDFEASIFPHHPTIATLKETMYEAGALYASMTGSGSTVYGIFESKTDHNWHWIDLNR